jgi:hypothetical protein
MSDWLMKLIRAEADRLVEMAHDDPALRAELRKLAEGILRGTTERDADLPPSAAERPRDVPDAESPGEPLHELTLGQPKPTAPPTAASAHQGGPRGVTSDDSDSLQHRCRQKADAARWAAEIQRRLHEGTPVGAGSAALDGLLAEWAQRLADGYYWLRAEEGSPESDLAALEDVAGCFEALAEGLGLAQETDGHSQAFERALAYVAEAQSAARRALQRLGISGDPEQEEAYEWLRAAAARHRLYLRRHMRADDLADPAGWSALLASIEETRSRGRRTPLVAAQLETIRSHRDAITLGGPATDDWGAIMGSIDVLMKAGMAPSSRDLRDLLLPLIDDLPDRDDLPRSFKLVLREIDRFLATRHAFGRGTKPQLPSAEVTEVARLLAGTSVVLIGGDRRRDAQEALRHSFQLDAVLWIATKEHQSFETFEPLIARPDVSLVLLAIRWSSHGFGEVRHLCDSHGKPLVRLPGGFNPNQVASQILAQCSEQLRRQVAPNSEAEAGPGDA